MKTRYFLDMGAHSYAHHAQLSLSGTDLAYSCGEDAYFISPSTNFMGVADGVSAWSAYALGNSAYIAYYLMSNSKRFAEKGLVDTQEIIHNSFDAVWALYEQKQVQIPNGSATICVVKLKDDDLPEPVIQYSTLGDSMLMVIRPERFDDMNLNLRIVHQSTKLYALEQVNGTPVPLQLCFYPFQGRRGTGAPEQVDKSESMEVELRQGDICVVATDGLWDNVTIDEVLKNVSSGFANGAGNNINSNDLAKRLVENALKNNFKPDDITVLVGVVREQFKQSL